MDSYAEHCHDLFGTHNLQAWGLPGRPWLCQEGPKISQRWVKKNMQNMAPLISTENKMRDLEERLERSEVQQGKLMLNLAETQRMFYIKQNPGYPDVQVVR